MVALKMMARARNKNPAPEYIWVKNIDSSPTKASSNSSENLFIKSFVKTEILEEENEFMIMERICSIKFIPAQSEVKE